MVMGSITILYKKCRRKEEAASESTAAISKELMKKKREKVPSGKASMRVLLKQNRVTAGSAKP